MCSWSTPLTIPGRGRAVVGGGWCEPCQCEGACYCVLHGNTVPPSTSGTHAGEEVASDHSTPLHSVAEGDQENVTFFAPG